MTIDKKRDSREKRGSLIVKPLLIAVAVIAALLIFAMNGSGISFQYSLF